MEYLAAEDEDNSSVCSSENLGTIQEIRNKYDADDELSSQASASSGIMVTPDLKSGPFKYPNVTSPKKLESSSVASSQFSERENDDGFCSADHEIDFCTSEGMDVL